MTVQPISTSEFSTPPSVLNLTTTTTTTSATRTTVVAGTVARQIAAAQGHTWEGIAETVAISQHIETVEMIDRRGDQLMRAHLNLLARAAAMARREGAVQTEAMLHEAIAQGHELDEIDDHEDAHRQEMGGRARGATGHLRVVSGLHGRLLGHKDAVCGRIKPATDEVVYRACQQLAGRAGDSHVCVFEAIQIREAQLP